MRLGNTQRSILRSLVEHKSWFGEGYGCGWIWGNYSNTKRLLDSLVKRGLVDVTEEKGNMPYNKTTTYRVYRPTEAGKAEVYADHR